MCSRSLSAIAIIILVNCLLSAFAAYADSGISFSGSGRGSIEPISSWSEVFGPCTAGVKG